MNGDTAILASDIVRILTGKGMTISFAESLTGGMISSEIVSVSGASACFEGSVVSYSNDIKIKLLNVSEDVIRNFGAVSELCAKQMASGGRRLTGTDIAVSATGIAGPSGGSDSKPVGTVYIGLSCEDKCFADHFIFEGDRESVREQTVIEAYRMVLGLINE